MANAELVEILRWVFFVGFLFLIMVGVWALIVVTRMQREQTVALGLLNVLAAKAGLQRATDKLEDTLTPPPGGHPREARPQRSHD